MFNLVVETYEGTRPTPVVTHIFHGNTPEQAQAFFRAHCKADKFLRDYAKGRFANFRCRNRIVGMTEG